MSVRVYVDTNVLIYARDGRFPEKQARAQVWLRELARRSSMVISLPAIQEHHSVASRKLGLDPEAAAAATLSLLAWCERGVEPADIARALDIQRAHKTSWWDALHIAAALGAGCTHILTEDAQSAPTIEGLRFVDPFGAAPEALF